MCVFIIRFVFLSILIWCLCLSTLSASCCNSYGTSHTPITNPTVSSTPNSAQHPYSPSNYHPNQDALPHAHAHHPSISIYSLLQYYLHISMVLILTFISIFAYGHQCLVTIMLLLHYLLFIITVSFCKNCWHRPSLLSLASLFIFISVKLCITVCGLSCFFIKGCVRSLWIGDAGTFLVEISVDCLAHVLAFAWA